MTSRASVRPVTPGDAAAWTRLRTRLWPEWPEDHPKEIAAYFESSSEDVACFVAEDAQGEGP